MRTIVSVIIIENSGEKTKIFFWIVCQPSETLNKWCPHSGHKDENVSLDGAIVIDLVLV
jgi:hypothetical protein